MGKDLQFTMEDTTEEFQASPENILQALNMTFTIFEEQALQYISGFVLNKVLKKFHVTECGKCCLFSSKVTIQTREIQEHEVFVWLKRFDDDNCTLFSPQPCFTAYVRNIFQVVEFLLFNNLCNYKLMKSLNNIVLKYIFPPKFCCPKVQESTVALVIKTLVLYKLKWMNSSLKSDLKSSTRKLKILKHC